LNSIKKYLGDGLAELELLFEEDKDEFQFENITHLGIEDKIEQIFEQLHSS